VRQCASLLLLVLVGCSGPQPSPGLSASAEATVVARRTLLATEPPPVAPRNGAGPVALDPAPSAAVRAIEPCIDSQGVERPADHWLCRAVAGAIPTPAPTATPVPPPALAQTAAEVESAAAGVPPSAETALGEPLASPAPSPGASTGDAPGEQSEASEAAQRLAVKQALQALASDVHQAVDGLQRVGTLLEPLAARNDAVYMPEWRGALLLFGDRLRASATRLQAARPMPATSDQRLAAVQARARQFGQGVDTYAEGVDRALKFPDRVATASALVAQTTTLPTLIGEGRDLDRAVEGLAAQYGD
jgi:hypothetical protein